MVEYEWRQPHLRHSHFLLALPDYGNDVGVVGIGRTPLFLRNLFYLEQIFYLFAYFFFVNRLCRNVWPPNFDHMFIMLLIVSVQNIEQIFSCKCEIKFSLFIKSEIFTFTPSEGDSSSQNDKMICWSAIIFSEMDYCPKAKNYPFLPHVNM